MDSRAGGTAAGRGRRPWEPHGRQRQCNARRLTFALNARDRGFPGGTVDKNLLANAWDTVSIPDWERSHMHWSN